MAKRKPTSTPRRPRDNRGRFISEAELNWFREAFAAHVAAARMPSDEKLRGPTRSLPRNNKGQFIAAVKADDGRHYADPTHGGLTPTKRRSRAQQLRDREFDKAIKAKRLPKYDKRDDADSHKERGERIYQRVNAYLWRVSNLARTRKLLATIANKYGDSARVRVAIGIGFGKNSNWVGSPFDVPGGAARYLNVWTEKSSSQPVIEQAGGDDRVWFEVELLLRDRKL